MAQLRCWNCGESIDEVPHPISRHATCGACFNELHCCRQCRHYQMERVGAQCDEDRADPPVVKETANFCDWFRPNPAAFRGHTAARRDAARSKLDALFAGEPEDPGTAPTDAAPETETGTEKAATAPQNPQSKEEEARAKLDALFDKDPPKNKV